MTKLSNKRKIASLIIILVGLASSAFILNQDKSAINTSNKTNEEQGELLSFESLVSEAKTNNIDSGEDSNSNSDKNNNLTDNLISSFASNVAGNENLNITENQENKLVEQSFSTSFTQDAFESGDIKISKSNSDKAKIEYIEKIDGDLNEIAKGFGGETATTTISKFLQEQNSKPINHLISNIPILIDKLLQTEVPPSFAEIHVDLLNAWQKKLDIYTAIKNYQDDPLKASVGIKKFEDAAEKQLNAQMELINIYNNLKNEN